MQNMELENFPKQFRFSIFQTQTQTKTRLCQEDVPIAFESQVA